MKEELEAEKKPGVLTGLARLHQMAEPRTVASPRRKTEYESLTDAPFGSKQEARPPEDVYRFSN